MRRTNFLLKWDIRLIRNLLALNVAEKPSVAKTVSEILSSNSGLMKLESASQYNPVYEFEYELENKQTKMIFTSLTGHLMEMKFPDSVQKTWNLDTIDELFKCIFLIKQALLRKKWMRTQLISKKIWRNTQSKVVIMKGYRHAYTMARLW